MEFEGGAAVAAGLIGGAAMGFLMLHLVYGVLVGAFYTAFT